MTADRIRWINHAGFELQTEGSSHCLRSLASRVSLQSKLGAISRPTLRRDLIWLSHEHPDHFSPASLRAIPKDIRAKITVLFQKAKDGRVAKFCRDPGVKGGARAAELAARRIGARSVVFLAPAG